MINHLSINSSASTAKLYDHVTAFTAYTPLIHQLHSKTVSPCDNITSIHSGAMFTIFAMYVADNGATKSNS